MRIALTAVMVLLGLVLPAYAQDIRDVKPPVDFPVNYFPLIGFTGAVTSLAVWWLYRRWRKHRAVKSLEAVQPLTPWEKAAQSLQALEQEGLPARGMVNLYYTRLSTIARHYIEERFAIPAAEMTTEEFLHKLKQENVFSAKQKELLQEFLNGSDMAKFARHVPSATQMELSLVQIKQLIVETTPVASVPAAQGSKA